RNFISNDWAASENINGTPGAQNSIYDIEAPKANFSFSSIIDEAQMASFDATNSSDNKGVTNYEWNFGDTNTTSGASIAQISHLYDSNNTYTITLTVQDAAGFTGVLIENLIVSDLDPTANATDNLGVDLDGYTIAEGATLSVTGLNSVALGPDAITTYFWDFGDGATNAASTASNIYFENKTYTGNLTVSDTDSKGVDQFTITVTDVDPTAEAGNDTIANEDTLIIFNASDSVAGSISTDPIANWEWDFGDGSSVKFGEVVNHTYTLNGTYTVTLTVHDEDSTDQDTLQSNISFVNDAPTTTQFNLTFDEDQYNASINLTKYVTDEEDAAENISWISNTPINLVVIISNKILNVSANKDWYGEENLTLTATDLLGATTDVNVIVTVSPINDIPILQNITNQSVTQDSKISFTLSASDVDNDNFTFYKDVSFGTLNQTSGLFEWTPTSSDYGIYEINFLVNDTSTLGYLTGTIATHIRVFSTLNISEVDVNINPAYDNLNEEQIIPNIIPGQTITTTIKVDNNGADKIDNGNVTLTISALGVNEVVQLIDPLESGSSDSITIEYKTPTLTPEGTYKVDIKTEGEDHFPTEYRYSNFSFYINITKQTDDVVIENASLNTSSAKCTSPVKLSVNLTNKGKTNFDDVNLSIKQSSLGIAQYQIFNIPADTYQSADYELNISNKAAGTYEIEVMMQYYSNTLQDIKTVTLEIVNCEPEKFLDVPAITIPEDNYDATTNLSEYFQDFNDDDLTFDQEGAKNLTFDFLSNGLVNITSDRNFNGTESINFTAYDGVNLTKSNIVTITVTQINDPPEIESIDDTTAQQGENFTYQVIARDIENDTLTYTLNVNDTILESIASINQSGYINTWVPINEQVDKAYLFNVSVNDGINQTSTLFAVTVLNTNDAPIFNTSVSIADFSWDEDKTNSSLNISASFYDLDGDNLEYEYNTTGLVNITIDSITKGIVTLRPTIKHFEGTETTNFRAKDPSGTYSNWSNSVSLTVNPINDVPEIVSFSPSTISVISEAYAYDVEATDADNDVLTYSTNTTIFTINSTDGRISFVPSTRGTHDINVTVNDNNGGIDSDKFTLTIYNNLEIENTLLSIEGGSFTPISEGQTHSDSIQQGETLELQADFKNWMSTYKIDLIVVNLTLQDGAYIATKEATIAGLEKGQQTTKTIDFGEIPSDAPNGKYNISIKALGYYNNYDNTTNIEWKGFINVQSDVYQILTTSASITPSSVQCVREITIDATVKNLDPILSQNITVTVIRSTLGMNKQSEAKVISSTQSDTFSIPINISFDSPSGNHSITIRAESDFGSISEVTRNLEVRKCELVFSPSEDPIVGYKDNYVFSVSTNGADFTIDTIEWEKGGVSVGDGTSSHTYIAENQTGRIPHTIFVRVTDTRGNQIEKNWLLTTTSYPIADTLTVSPNLAALNQTQLQNVTLVIEQAGIGNIQFLQPINLSGIVSLDNHINVVNGIIAINSSASYNVLSEPAKITLTGLAYDTTPDIFYSSGFTTTPSDISTECTNTFCFIESYTHAPTTTGTVVFNVTHFSSFRVGTEIIPPSNVPVANAGSDRTVAVDTLVTLDASSSSGTEPLTYRWSAPSGITLSSTISLRPTFTPTQTGTYTFPLVVSNDYGSDTDTVTITVQETLSSPGATGNLTISDLDIKVGDKTHKDVLNGDKISKEAEPGDTIKFMIELENLFSSSSDIEIQEIEVTVTIDNIDDGDELEESEDVDDIKAGKDEDITIELEIPTLVNEDTYDITIEVEAEDEDGNDHDIVWELTLDVEKESHALVIDKAKLSPQTIRCERETSLEVEVVNTGSKDEDDVSIEIKSIPLNLEIIEEDIDELEEGDDSDSIFEKTYRLQFDNKLKPGTYPITITADYNSHEGDEKTIDLIVEECVDKKTLVESTRVDIVKATDKITTPLPTTEVKFRDTSEYVTLLAVLFIILIGAIVFGVGAVVILSKKK
ncbi:MAG: PKD domain-containing protein, partial [Nanoarchaeota archaeon]|nr:PKD domain-containing protein [Nanoarchaeota archaeon]